MADAGEEVESVVLGRACNWSVALYVAGVVMGLLITASWVLWVVMMAVTLWVGKRQFRSMERLIDGHFGSNAEPVQ